MKIMVFDVAAESGGALSVLNDFYRKFTKDEANEYIFVISKPQMKETTNIQILQYPWIKKSWFHRLFFDYFIAPHLIRKYKINKSISLQNTIIPNTKVEQTVFFHNALFVSDYRFSFKEDKLLWIYQNILSIVIFQSLKKADSIIVQTKWMKDICSKKINIKSDKIEVFPPQININVTKKFTQCKENYSTFFYPASGVIFKNHKIILEACIELKKKGIMDYKVIFTLHGNESSEMKALYEKSIRFDLPIRFIGDLTREQVFEYYAKSVLIFPSYIETVGLPLLEAKIHEAPIIVSDCAFSHEILDDYTLVDYFDFTDSIKLADFMQRSISIII